MMPEVVRRAAGTRAATLHSMPHTTHRHRDAAIDTLLDAPTQDGPTRGGDLPAGLRRYGARLAVRLRSDRPTVIVNFVESLDGVVTFDPQHGSGAEVSGFNEPDRFVMGLLRSLADVVVVGAGTVRAAPNHAWTPGGVHRGTTEAYAAWRRAMGLAPEPTAMLVTASGDIAPDHPALHVPGTEPIVLTTAHGAKRLRGTLPPSVRLREADGDSVRAAAVLAVATAEGARVVLCEGGPHLLGTFASERLIDDMFLTLAPQLIGRSGVETTRRLGLLEGVAFEMDNAPWGQLESIHRSVDHLFLRYAFGRD